MKVLLYIISFPGAVRISPNVAVKGTATQSSTSVNTRYVASPFVASYANDGNFDTNLVLRSGACSYTKNTAPFWWQVDLLKVFEINKVAITTRSVVGK